MDFYNLYMQTEYSILNSTIHISRLAKRLELEGAKYCAICDDGMFGTIKFIKEMKKINVKPIIGLRCEYKNEYNYIDTLLLFAKGIEGYKNLLKISSIKETRSLMFDDIKKYCKDIVVVAASIESYLYKLYKLSKMTEFLNEVNRCKNSFEEFYVGIDVCQASNAFSNFIYENMNKYDIKPVAIHKTCFMSDDEFEVYRILKSVLNNNTSYQEKDYERFYNYVDILNIKSEMNKYPIAFRNIEEICDKCDVDLEFGVFHLPKFKDESFDSKGYLKELCMFGLKRRLSKITKFDINVYINRLNYELDIIDKMGFNDYFLIVYDFVKYSKLNNILVGCGRGSGPNSLVSYVLGISEVNPIEYDLLFERFLSLERKTMPDIDIDFSDLRRSDVIKYVGEKYGRNKVCHITALGTYGPKGAIKDVCRIKKIDDLFSKELTKYINIFGSFENCFKDDRFNRFINENKNIRDCVNYCRIMENLPRNVSTHAAGIIISDKDLCEYTALIPGLNGLFQSQFDKDDLESLGLVKMDFLSLRNLTSIDEIVKDIKENENINIDINKIDLWDKKVYELISRGDTLGIFQLESSGMRSVLKRLKPTCIMDISHVNALYRPGPMDMIDTFIKRKNKEEIVVYPHESIKDVLKQTYGIIVFQEQIMQIAKVFAGYSLGEADILRRAVSKKKRDVLENERVKFVSRSIKVGRDEKTANLIYDYIVKFADYGFNKAHAVSYSVIAYQMAYLKTHYFSYFMANLITQASHDTKVLQSYISECKKNGVSIEYPSINLSGFKCGIKANKIYLPLTIINSVGSVIVGKILDERLKGGFFKSYEDFVYRLNNDINKAQIVKLIEAGCFDEFGLTKKAMVEAYDQIIMRKNFIALGDKLKEHVYITEEYTFEEISEIELNAIGFNLKFDPFVKYKGYKKKYRAIDLENVGKLRFNTSYVFVCRINRIREVMTKTNKLMAFLELKDETSTVDAVVFNEKYMPLRNELISGDVYLFKGTIQKKDDKVQVIIENAFIIH